MMPAILSSPIDAAPMAQNLVIDERSHRRRTLWIWLLYCLSRLLVDAATWLTFGETTRRDLGGLVWWIYRGHAAAICGGLLAFAFSFSPRMVRPEGTPELMILRWMSVTSAMMMGCFAAAFIQSNFVPTLASLVSSSTSVLVWGVVWMIIERAALVVDQNRLLAMASQAEARAREADLRSVRHRIGPHFLFNSLNTIRALVTENAQLADFAITKLARVLRYSLQTNTAPLVSLREELSAVEDYLDMEKLRFEQRLSWKIDADPAILNALLPPMLLQNLVENGIKHGVEQQATPGLISVEAHVDGPTLVVSVQSPYREDQPSHQNSTGTGVSLIRQQLTSLFGASASLLYTQPAAGAIQAIMRVPLSQKETL